MNLKDLFLLDPSVTFLNHGSFGACPRPVFEVYQEWQRRLERQPVQFLDRDFAAHMLAARHSLGCSLNAPDEDLVFIGNATYGVNVVARSLNLQPGDEILSTDHEYGAVDRTWQFLCQKVGAIYKRIALELPIAPAHELVQQIWAGVTERTRLIALSHITSPTAQVLPVEVICARARQAGILTLVDGAHAPGQLPLDLQSIGADFYSGNCHKWMLAPKGSAFLYARPESQGILEPLVVSWGWRAEASFTSGSQFIDYLQWRGTHDPSACLAVPTAIRFMHEHDWDRVRDECRLLLSRALQRVRQLTGMPDVYTPERLAYHQMAIAELPLQSDLMAFKSRLYEQYRVEVPCIEWGGRHFIRISVQAYNSLEDIEALTQALEQML
ncbi:MAG: aminotransferase class V-fold PLP-dependent enzyme [Anaerolineales bacterium]